MTHASDAWVNGNLVIKSYRQNPLVNLFPKTHGTQCITLYCHDQLLTPTNVSLLFSLSLPLLFISSSLLLTSFHRLFFLFFFIFLSDSSHRCFFSLLSHYYSNNNVLYFSLPFVYFFSPSGLIISLALSFHLFLLVFFFFPLICTGRELLFRPKQTGIWGIVLISLHGRASGSPRPPPISLVQWRSHIVAWGAVAPAKFFFFPLAYEEKLIRPLEHFTAAPPPPPPPTHFS